MANIFLNGKYDSNKRIIDFLVARGAGEVPMLDNEDLRTSYRGNKEQTILKMLVSLGNCADTYWANEEKRKKSQMAQHPS